tara:strand:- start:122 stop:379 length:258 start_codon:yes stop_codon:yes gene_type:complete
MAFYKKAAKGLSPGSHPYTRGDMKRVNWCMNKGIKIAVIPNGIDWQVELNINKKIHLNPEIYKADKAYEKMYEYYKYYYDKYNKQ